MPGLLSKILHGRRSHGARGGGGCGFGDGRSCYARPSAAVRRPWIYGTGRRGAGDAEAAARSPIRHLRHEALHTMTPLMVDDDEAVHTMTPLMVDDDKPSTQAINVQRVVEKQLRSKGRQKALQVEREKRTTKEQLLQAKTAYDFIERVELLVNEDWLGKTEALPGNMYRIASFGLFDVKKRATLDKRKARARFVGFFVMFLLQVTGAPIVFFAAFMGFGVENEFRFNWELWDMNDRFQDWKIIALTKLLGILFLFVFLLNAMFVILDMKQSWFKLYNIFRYLRHRIPDFHNRSEIFLYVGAFINCWTVMWCCIASFVVTGASKTPKRVILDSLGLFFLYNLDDVGGKLGFVDEDDWPGVRLGWVFSEMVKKDWQRVDEEAPVTERRFCINCQRPPAPGQDSNGRPFDTCCRGCARSLAHDPECKPYVTEDTMTGMPGERIPLLPEDEDVGRENWNMSGYIVKFMFQATILVVAVLIVVLPLLAIHMPFTLIVPPAYDH